MLPMFCFYGILLSLLPNSGYKLSLTTLNCPQGGSTQYFCHGSWLTQTASLPKPKIYERI